MPGASAQSEVQDITVSATSGYFYLEDAETKDNDESSPLPYNATTQAVQAALEGLYGVGNVEVPKGQGNEAGSEPYEVTFTRKLAGRPVGLVVAKSLPFNPVLCNILHHCPLGGGRAEAKVTEVTHGMGSGDVLVVTATNLGDTPLSGEAKPLAIVDSLPAGVTAYDVEAFTVGERGAAPLSCELREPAATQPEPICRYSGSLQPYEFIEMFIPVNVEAGAKSGVNRVSVSGGQIGECKEVAAAQGGFLESLCLVQPGSGEAAGDFEVLPISETSVQAQSLSRPLPIRDGSTPFGIEQYEMKPEEEGGTPTMQAGGHPFQLTTTVRLNAGAETVDLAQRGSGKRLFDVAQPAMPKDLTFKLPPGLIGNPTAFPQCSNSQFETYPEGGGGGNACPADTALGVAIVQLDVPSLHTFAAAIPVFNLVPDRGEPARFGFEANRAPIILDTSVRTGGDYGITVTVHNTNQTPAYLFSQVTIWGTPGSAAHMLSRGNECMYANNSRLYAHGACGGAAAPSRVPFLTMPTSCAADPTNEPLVSTMEGNSWAAFGIEAQNVEPASYTFENSSGGPLGLSGCNGLDFEPSIKAAPDVQDASTPTGLTVNVHVPQDAALNPEGTAESAVKRIEVTLPEGVTVNPGGAGGLQACSLAQIGYLPGQSTPSEQHFTSTFPSCPDQSKIATVTVKTPLLPNPLEGAVYLATPAPFGELNANPFDSLIAMYLVAEDPVSGVLVKLPMHVSLDESTGRVFTTVDNPPLPFEDAELHFFGGGRAPLATPGLCGSYATQALFTPWSGNEPVRSTSTFTITSGPNGSPCPSNPRPFAPGFQAGTTNIQAGAFTPFTNALGHPDGDQPLAAVSMKLPPGLSGSLSGVKLCPEPQASQGTCGAESLIGHTVVTAGLGSTPAVVARPGRVYITGPYEGAPFGLSIVNPAETGPFNLGEVVVRGKIEVGPLTAQLTVTTDPSGPFRIPTMLDGIPLQLQHVGVTVDRPDFTFNPTNCAAMKIEGTMTSGEGATAPISTPFQVTNCATLGFKPKFVVSTAGHTSRARGASLKVKLSYPKAPFGTQANIRSVHVELPKALPSRLSTLNHACLDSVFNRDPASCPSQSRVGFAKAVTPVLPVPLEGPAYFVSHGGQRFPELIVVLQGYGVTVYLQGETFISKAGVTSSTFKTVPDVPVGSFELTLPEGPFSALAANRDLCATNLVMPNTFDAQNGAVLHRNTPIEVEGCPYALRIVHRGVKKRTLTLKVSVPQGGRLVASGKGVSKAAKTAKGRSTLTLTLKEGHAGKLRTKVLLRFTPKGATGKQRGKGAKILRKRLTVTFR